MTARPGRVSARKIADGNRGDGKAHGAELGRPERRQPGADRRECRGPGDDGDSDGDDRRRVDAGGGIADGDRRTLKAPRDLIVPGISACGELIDKRLFRGSAVSMDHSSRPMPPLETLHAFEVAARAGSFSAAAEKLNLTHGAVSRQIAKLEAWLGLKVFDRGARGVALTIEGQRLFLRTSEAFALIADNTDRWVEPRGAAVVRLASIPSICGLWLIPRLTALEQRQAAAAHRARGRHPPEPTSPTKASIFRCAADAAASPAAFRCSCSRSTASRSRRRNSPTAIGAGTTGTAAQISADPRFRCIGMARLARRPRHRLPAAAARPPLRGLQSGARRGRERARHRAGAPAAHRAASLVDGRLAPVDKRTVLQPGLVLARPAARALRPAAAELARRIAVEAGVATGKLDAFLRAER